MPICDICGESITDREMKTLSEGQVVRATSSGYVPSTLPLQGFAEQFGLSLSKGDQWRRTVSKYKGTGAEWGVCEECCTEVLRFLESHKG